MRVQFHNTWSKVVDGVDRHSLRQALSIQFEVWRRVGGVPQLDIRTVTLERNFWFPSGLIWWAGAKLGLPVRVEDRRIKPEPTELLSNARFPFSFRDYQAEAIRAMLSSTRGIVKHPTGSGKTLTAAGLISSLGLPTVYVVPNLEILTQTVGKFSAWFGKKYVGQIGGKKKHISLVTVATAQGMWSLQVRNDPLWNTLKKANVLFIDESHHVGQSGKRVKVNGKTVWKSGNTWFDMALKIDAYYRFGMTATPGKPGSKERFFLEAATGKIIHEVPVDRLIADGLLARPVIYFQDFHHNRYFRDWREAMRLGIYENIERNSAITKITRRFVEAGKRVLILVDRVETQGKLLESMLSDIAVFVHGETDAETRQKVRRAFEVGKLKVLIGTVFNEGVDIPALDVAIVASGGKGGPGGRKAIQRLGRALRTHKKKEVAFLVDFFDHDGGVLQRHSRARMRAYETEGFEVKRF